MDRQEQISKLEERLYKIKEKKKKILEDEKEILEKLKIARQKKEEEDNRNLAALVEEQIGKMSESKLQALKHFLAQHAGEFVSEEKNSSGTELRDGQGFAGTESVREENFLEKSQSDPEIISEDSRKDNEERSGYHWQGTVDS